MYCETQMIPSCLSRIHLWGGLPSCACDCTEYVAILTCHTLPSTPPKRQRYKYTGFNKTLQIIIIVVVVVVFIIVHVTCLSTVISWTQIKSCVKYCSLPTFSGSWDSTSFLSRRSRKGRSTWECKDKWHIVQYVVTLSIQTLSTSFPRCVRAIS